MRWAARRNEFERRCLVAAVRSLGPWAERKARDAVRSHGSHQAALRRRYAVTDDTPISRYDDATRARARRCVASTPGAALVKTSGSTDQPKEIAYTPDRLRAVKRSFAGVTLRTVRAQRIETPIIFTLASLSHDDSLTALLTQGQPSRLDQLLTPHCVLSHPVFAHSIEKFGAHAVRLWAMVLANPGWLYATNPSTIAVFLQALRDDWSGSTAMLRAFRQDPGAFDADVSVQAVRIVSPGWRSRSDAMLASAEMPGVEAVFPRLRTFSSWDGGNTQAFLAQARGLLPGIRFVPMFSMATETLQTLTVFEQGEPRFLPIAPGVLYEFLPEGAPELPSDLLGPHQLEVGQRYSMVVSDDYGLRRYQTDDVFVCHSLCRGLPDLRFLRRQGLAWSFTGEKLTGAQVEMAFAAVSAEHPGDSHLTLIPFEEPGDAPGYRLVVAERDTAVPRQSAIGPDLGNLAASFDTHLQRINEEYASKRCSRRLAAPTAHRVAYDDLAAALRSTGDATARSWDSQFKLLPLLQCTWQDLQIDSVSVHEA